MKSNKIDLSLYLVTDRGVCQGDFLQTIEEALKGGVTIVQLREKECSTSDFIELATKVKQITTTYRVPLIINDRVDVALAVDADGIHLGQSDMDYTTARRLLGADKIIGLSAENLEQIEAANSLDVDYVAISPIFSTPTKSDTAEAFGLSGASVAVALSRHQIVAIGGINLSNLEAVMATGINGVALVSAIMSNDNPKSSAASLLSTIISVK